MSDASNSPSGLAPTLVCADLLAQGSKVHYLSVTMSGVAALALMLMSNMVLITAMLLMAVIVLGLLELMYAIRVGFDSALLRRLANKQLGSTKELDDTLIELKLIPSKKRGRELNDRLQGCMALFKTQVIFCLLQALVLLSIAGLLMTH